ncbi:hypothetical protein GW17_00005033 [Ensete ventricosum]|nr:hypothetical protein GW17_00005033 [Ensete ventricosum]
MLSLLVCCVHSVSLIASLSEPPTLSKSAFHVEQRVNGHGILMAVRRTIRNLRRPLIRRIQRHLNSNKPRRRKRRPSVTPLLHFVMGLSSFREALKT